MRRTQWLLLLLLIVALLVRVWYLRINPLLPQFSNADDGDYYRRALRLAVTGRYVDDAWLIRPPLHVFVFAGLIRVALEAGGSPATGVRLIQGFHLLLGILMVPLCYALGSRLFSRSAGLVFACFWAIWFPFVELPATLFSEPIYLFLWVLHLWLLLRFEDEGRLRDLLLAGLVLGMAALTRSPALYALVFAAPWLVFRQFRRDAAVETVPGTSLLTRVLQASRASVRPFALLTLATLLVVLPWTARNWIVYRQLIVIDTLGPINLWLDLGEAGERDAKIRALEALPQAERQAYAMDQARAILRDDPLRPFRPVWGTFRHIWKAQYVEDYFLKRSFFTRPLREAAPLGLPGDILWLVFSFAGIAGILHPATDRPFKIVLGLWLVYSIVTVLIFHVEPRYLLTIWLLLGLYGATMLVPHDYEAPRLHAYRVRALTTTGLLIVLALLFATYRNYPSILAQGIRRELAMWRGERAYGAGNYSAAEQAYRRALDIDQGFVEAEVGLALTLGAQGREAEGLEVVAPGDSRRSAVVEGVLLRRNGKLDEARELLAPSEFRAGEDAQRWALTTVRSEPRQGIILGDDALDLGYIAGFGGSESAGGRAMRWLLGQGTVSLPLTEPLRVGSSVMLDLAVPLPQSGPLDLVVNGGWHVRLAVSPEWRRYHLMLSDSLAGQQRLRLDLRAPVTIPALAGSGGDDARPLSVMVHSVRVAP
jgi:4-amino-4-deoxy-L-arabinose transferase-like glycosyltransferase